jgi:hypothetical protein
MKTKMTIISVLVTLALLSPLAESQVFYRAPLTGFNPVTASDAELAAYGIPPRPDQSQPALYAHWVKLVTAPQTRLTNPSVQTTDIINGVARGRQDRGMIANAVSTTTDNWSGYAISTAGGTFKKNNSSIFSEYTMPNIGVDNCSDKPYAMSEWVGIDGFDSDDVLQAGTVSTPCGTSGTSYVAWYEWYEAGCTSSSASYPCYQTNVSLPVSPGDLIEVEVWYTTAAPKGHAYILNFTTGKSVSVGFNQPSGTATYEGNSAEWIVERPELNGALVDLANYLGAPMNFDYAYNGSYFYPSSSPSGTIYDITMTCPAWDPSSACKKTTDLSTVDLYGKYALWFYVEGPAYP